MAGVGSVRVLVMHQSLLLDKDEAREVTELTAGLVARARITGDMQVRLSDGKRAYRLDLSGSRPRPVPIGSHRDAVRTADVVHVHMLLHWSHLLIAAQARLRGARIVFSPMSMLGEDFARSSWFRQRSAAFGLVKPLLVRALRALWLVVADVFVAASDEEIRQGRLPGDRTVLVPLAAPDSPLASAALDHQATSLTTPTDAPVMFLTRFDVYRKGIDRMCAWLDAEADRLPRPAVLLLAPADDSAPPEIAALAARGLLEWDPETRGPDVVTRLAGCRAVMLLSRWDGQPRVLREGALAGVPTISTASSHFEPVVRALGIGAIVDGDAPDSIQAAYEAVAEQDRAPASARRLFDRDEIGGYLYDLMKAVAARRFSAVERSYYDRFVSKDAR